MYACTCIVGEWTTCIMLSKLKSCLYYKHARAVMHSYWTHAQLLDSMQYTLTLALKIICRIGWQLYAQIVYVANIHTWLSHRNVIRIFSVEFTLKSEVSINTAILVTYSIAKFRLVMVSFVTVKRLEISTSQMYQLFSHIAIS